MVSAASKAGMQSRWGDMEKDRAVSMALNYFSNSNDNALVSQEVNPMFSSSKKQNALYAMRNSMVSAASKAGMQSRWGDMEKDRAVSMALNYFSNSNDNALVSQE